MKCFRGLTEELKYVFHVVFHPFDGFWDIKHEKRGSVRTSLVLIGLLVLVFALEEQFTGYYFSSSDKKGILLQITSVFLPLMIWCISNWCICTLVEGEGTFRDIVTVTGYAVSPMIGLHIVMIVFSNFATADSADFYSIIAFVAAAWSVFLMFVGIMTIHQFTASKTISTCLIAIVGMVVIVFLVIMFLTIIQQVYSMFYTMWREIILRL